MLLPHTDLSGGTLVRFGAGTSLDIENRLRAGQAPARVILIEPHPDLAKALAKRLDGWPQVTVLTVAAVAATSQQRDGMLNLFSDLSHSSLHTPLPALRALLPGLRQTGAIPVSVQTADVLLDGLGDLPQPLHVEIDAPGAELDILSALKEAGHLDRLASIDLRAGAEPLYEHAISATEITRWLEAAGFRLQMSLTDDPDWPEQRLVADLAGRALQRQVQDLMALTAAQLDQIGSLHQTITDRDVALVAAEAQRQELAGEIRRLSEENSHLRDKGDALGQRFADLEQRHHQAEIQRQDLEHLGREQGAALQRLEASLTDAMAQTEAERGQAAARIAALQAELDQAREATGRAENWAQEQSERAGALSEQIETLGRDLAETRAVLEEVRAAATAAAQDADARVRAQTDLATATAAKLAEAEKLVVETKQKLDAKHRALLAAEAALTEARAGTEAAKETEAKLRAQTDLAASTAAKLATVEKLAAETRQKLDQSVLAVTATESRASAAKADAEAARTELATALAKASDLEKSIAQANQTVQAKGRDLTALQSVLTTATAEREALAAKVADLTKSLADRSARVQGLEQAQARHDADLAAKAQTLAETDQGAKQAKTDLADREAKLKASRDRITVLEKSIADLRGQIKVLEETLGRGTVELQTARQDLGTSLRLQNRLRTDLTDLQNRFETVQGIRRAQEDLLRQLTPRLRQAAQQLQSLKLMELAPESDVGAIATTGGKKSNKQGKKQKG